MKYLSRTKLLAADIFAYSYANYQDHSGIGSIRFDKLMPRDAKKLEKAIKQNWPVERIEQELDVDTDTATHLLEATKRAILVVDAGNPAESFRHAVRHVIQNAAEDGLNDDDAIEQAVTQICYRASDMAHLLEAEGSPLSIYSEHLRKEPDDDEM